MKFSGTIAYRPVRIGFLVAPDDLDSIIRATRLSMCLWGGRYNPIVPFFEIGGERWRGPSSALECLDVARRHIDFFEPEVLVESRPGMARRLGWDEDSRLFGLPRVLAIEKFYEINLHNVAEFAAGIDIQDVFADLYDTEFKFERRHKQTFAEFEKSPGDAYFDVVGGRYPEDASLHYVADTYRRIFEPEKLPADCTSALRLLRDGLATPSWLTRHGLREISGHHSQDLTFYFFNPTNPADVIDYWNYRLIVPEVVPISISWLSELAPWIRETVETNNSPVPGNPSGLRYQSAFCFASSIDPAFCAEILRDQFAEVTDGAFYQATDPHFCSYRGNVPGGRVAKLIATGPAKSFEEKTDADLYAKIPATSPPFLNRSIRYTRDSWVNVVTTRTPYEDPEPAIVYPQNLWAPRFPRLNSSTDTRITREGWVIDSSYAADYVSVRLQGGRDSIIDWFKTVGIDATPSEEGQIAAQIIAAAGGLLPCIMFGDRETLRLLGDMAESHSTVLREGKSVTKSDPDRSKHINTVGAHFARREKLTNSIWCKLDYFLERSVFQAGLRVQCPVCAHRNWMSLDALSYKPTCARCLNSFKFSQAPEELRKVHWYYRVIGPFAAPDFARGGYAVALTLRTLRLPFDIDMTWSTGLSLSQLSCEVDFVAWHRVRHLTGGEHEEPVLLFGEAKSFGRNTIDESAIASLRKMGDQFPGSVIVVATLREGEELSVAEIGRLRQLALWGRRARHRGHPINPVVVLTAAELFSATGVAGAWRKIAGGDVSAIIDADDLYRLSDLTLKRYLGLGDSWNRHSGSKTLPTISNILRALRTKAAEKSD